MTDTQICTEASTEVIPRHVPDNPYNYSKDTLAKRSKQMKEMIRDYPHLPLGWIEMVLDFGINTPDDKIDKIINEGLWETPTSRQ